MSNRFEGGEGTVQVVIPLGTGAVSTQTKVVGVVPKHCRVTGVRFHGQAQVTATSLVAEVFARTRAGAAGATLQSATANIKFGSAALAKAGVAASLTATQEDKRLVENQLLEVVITADTCTAGPGDLVVEVQYTPHYNRA